MNRKEFIEQIKSNIEDFGWHVTFVNSAPSPNFAYTIGHLDKIGFELIFAGGIQFMKKDIHVIINAISLEVCKGDFKDEFEIEKYGVFRLRKVDSSWSRATMLGVFDYFKTETIKAFQILPPKEKFTIDIPNMGVKRDREKESCWNWLDNKWQYNVPSNTTVVTNLDALKGKTITEMMRWEEEEWEMFAGSGESTSKSDIRVVPIGILFAKDQTLISALNLNVGKGQWRKDRQSAWNEWG